MVRLIAMNLPDSDRSRRSAQSCPTTRLRRRTSRFRVFLTITVAGFCLAVFVLLAVSLIVPRLMQNIGLTKQKIAVLQAATIGNQLQIYLADNGLTKPTQRMSLTVLTQGPNPYLKLADLMDPWGRPYQLIVPGTGVTSVNIVSYGRDGVPGGAGPDADVVN